MNHNKLNSLALVLAVSMLCATTTVYAQDEADSSETAASTSSTETSESSSDSGSSAANTDASEPSVEPEPEVTNSASEPETETVAEAESSENADAADEETVAEEENSEDADAADEETVSEEAGSEDADAADEETVAEEESSEDADATDEETVAEEESSENADAADEETVAEEESGEDADAADEETVAEEEGSEDADATDEETVAEEEGSEDADAADEETVAEEESGEDADAADEETVAEEEGSEDADAADEETVAEEESGEDADAADEETVAEEESGEDADATDEETLAEEEGTEDADATDEEVAEEEASETDGPVWASQWAGGFFSVEGSSSNGNVDSICGLYENSTVENWAEAQWITVHGWMQLNSDDEEYTGPLQAKLLAGWYVSHPDSATCPTEAPCTGGSNAVADEEASQVVISDENGYVEFSVTGWWPGVDESFVEAEIADTDGENELELFAQYYVETHFGAKVYGESGEALGRFDRDDQESMEMSKDVFWYPAELSESCAYTPPPLPTCLIFAIHDHGLNDSYIFTLDPNDDFAVNELSFHENYDLEGLAIDPRANKLLASSGNDAQEGHSNGHLYQVDKETGDVTSIGDICYTDEEEQSHCNMEVSSLTFHPDGSLWGWAEGDGLLFIDPKTAEAKLVTASDAGIEDLAWNNSGKVVYAIAEDMLWAYDGYSLTAQCPMDSPAESIERLPDNVRAAYGLPEDHDVFMFAYHKESDLTMHALDAQTCEVLDAFRIPTTRFYDIEGISWVCNAGLDNPPPVFNSEESTINEDGEIIDSLKPISGEVINIADAEWDDKYNKQATAWVGGDSDDALAIRFKNIDLPKFYYVDSAYLMITNHLETETSLVEIKVQAEKSKTPASFDKDDLPTDRSLTESFHRYEHSKTWKNGDQLKIEITGPLRELANENFLGNTIALVLTGQGDSEDRKHFNIEDVQLVLNLHLISSQEPATVVVSSTSGNQTEGETSGTEGGTSSESESSDADASEEGNTETDVTDTDSNAGANSDEGSADSESTGTDATDSTEAEEPASESNDSETTEDSAPETDDSSSSETGDSGESTENSSETGETPVTDTPAETPSETGEGGDDSGENGFVPDPNYPSEDGQQEVGV